MSLVIYVYYKLSCTYDCAQDLISPALVITILYVVEPFSITFVLYIDYTSIASFAVSSSLSGFMSFPPAMMSYDYPHPVSRTYQYKKVSRSI